MKTPTQTTEKVLSILLKEPFTLHTATSMAKALGITRQGIWKTLHRLAEDKLISIEPVNDAKTSTAILTLSWRNPVTEKALSLLLTKESFEQQRWRTNFAELEDKAEFLILFGSIINNPKEANDIDLLAVMKKKNFKALDEIVSRIQQTMLKKVHLIGVTESEIINELKKPNKAYRDAIKKGVVLYGQDNFIQCIRDLKK